MMSYCFFFFFQAEDGIRDGHVTGVQTCALPISRKLSSPAKEPDPVRTIHSAIAKDTKIGAAPSAKRPRRPSSTVRTPCQEDDLRFPAPPGVLGPCPWLSAPQISSGSARPRRAASRAV